MIKFPLKLYGYTKYTNILINLYNKKKLPGSIIINGEEGIGKKIFIIDFLEKILKRSFVDLNHNNLIDDSGNITPTIKILNSTDNALVNIDTIREILKFSTKSSFNNASKFIIIFNVEKLNLYTANSLLKILEEPPVNTFFLLSKTSSKNLIKSLHSRCFVFNIRLSQSEKDEIFKKLLIDNGLDDLINLDYYPKYETPGLKISKTLYLKENNLINKKLIDIIFYCYEDFKKNKNNLALNYAIHFSIYFCRLNINNKFKNFYNIFDNFKSKLSNGIIYNSDLENAFKILNKLNK